MAFKSGNLQKWSKTVGQLNFWCPPGTGALWTGVGANSAFNIALKRGKFTLEMTNDGQSMNMKSGLLHKKLDEYFGEQFNNDKRMAWQFASQKYVSRLEGPVEIYIREGNTKIRDGMSKAEFTIIDRKILFDELMEMEIAGQVMGNGKIENVSIIEFNEKDEITSSYPMPISKEWN